MTNTVKIIIDDQEYEVPAGMNLIDAAKTIGNDIPIFCYHPKMEPVGMCRMCLVEMGAIDRDRQTGEVIMEGGKPKINWRPKLETACTTKVSNGLVIRTKTQRVDAARESVLEFLLTSHPLDCPICDKGGECPLQNLTMAHGPGVSRMHFEDKMHLDKHVPLGETGVLIYLDEERCIQCARCIRFQDEIVGDDVLAFHERGRSLQIITTSEPHGFDTYFSGNTTDVCPVGALTTADFRFGARPWELTNVPSICPHCPVGCNTSLSTRLDRDFDGRAMIKRVMPRQNEAVNEIWICDKGRFGHHFTRSDNRLLKPMIRRNGQLGEAGWGEALPVVAEAIKNAGDSIAAVAGSSLSNEDLWVLKQVVSGLGSERLGAWPPSHGGADLVAQVGVGAGTNLATLGAGDAVLIIATDLEEEAPIWRLRLKQAHDRGAFVAVANARKTRMDDFASEVVRYDSGMAAHFLNNLSRDNAALANELAKANNLVIVAGAEGLTLEGSRALMQAAANLLISSGHVGKPNNGLIGVFPGANAMGLHYLGYTPEATLDIAANPPKVLLVAGADLIADDPAAATWLSKVETVISLTMFRDGVSDYAAAVLPIQSFAERDGSFTNGERCIQRFYTAQGPMGEALPAWQVLSRLGEVLGQGRQKLSAAALMLDIVNAVPAFAGARYKELAKVEPQFPQMDREDVYYGGTVYNNTGGTGVQIPTAADQGSTPDVKAVQLPAVPTTSDDSLLIVPTTRLYNRERVFEPSVIVRPRVMLPYIEINSADADKLGITSGDVVEVNVPDAPKVRVRARVNGAVAQGTAVLPRHLTSTPTPLTLSVGQINKVGEPVAEL